MTLQSNMHDVPSTFSLESVPSASEPRAVSHCCDSVFSVKVWVSLHQISSCHILGAVTIQWFLQPKMGHSPKIGEGGKLWDPNVLFYFSLFINCFVVLTVSG